MEVFGDDGHIEPGLFCQHCVADQLFGVPLLMPAEIGEFRHAPSLGHLGRRLLR